MPVLSLLLASPPAEWSWSAGPVLWHDNDSLGSPNATSLCSEERGKRVNYHDKGDSEAGTDSGHCVQDDRNDFLITNGNGRL